METVRQIVGHVYGIFLEKICLKAPGNYSAPIWSYTFPICLWEHPKTLHVHDFGTLGRVPGSQNQLFLCFETPGFLKYSEKKQIALTK